MGKLRTTTYFLEFEDDELTKKELEQQLYNIFKEYPDDVIKYINTSCAIINNTWKVCIVLKHYSSIKGIKTTLTTLGNGSSSIKVFHNKKLHVNDLFSKV